MEVHAALLSYRLEMAMPLAIVTAMAVMLTVAVAAVAVTVATIRVVAIRLLHRAPHRLHRAHEFRPNLRSLGALVAFF